MTDIDHKIRLHELYQQYGDKTDQLVWDREADPITRRGFLKKGSLLAMSGALGADIVFASQMPAGMIPAALANAVVDLEIKGKSGLTVLNDRPVNAETPAHLLDDDLTKAEHFFVRNNGVPPNLDSLEKPEDWILEIAGESCERPSQFTLAQLKAKFKHHTYALTLECGGNGRSEFNPPAKGNQWTIGAVGCGAWTGVRLCDVLKSCGVKDDAVYIGYYGADTHLSGDPNKVAISRGVPIAKAMQEESLIAWAYNGQDIPFQNGYPLRLALGGWPASTSGKWLKKIVIRNQVHDGPKMGGQSYRVPCEPVAPGSKVPDEEMCIIEAMPVKSLITNPKSGLIHSLAEPFGFRGKAWAGELEVKHLFISIDFGATWQSAQLHPPANRLAWQKWQAEVRFPKKGYYEVWARATDAQGQSQPTILPGWNPRGYLNNACHRIAVQVV